MLSEILKLVNNSLEIITAIREDNPASRSCAIYAEQLEDTVKCLLKAHKKLIKEAQRLQKENKELKDGKDN